MPFPHILPVRRLSVALQTRVLLSAVWMATTAPAMADERRTGDTLSLALPLTTLACEFIVDERQGAWQYAESLTASLAASEVLKRVTKVERPDKSNRRSFPSGHAVGAFAAASFVHRRYGFEPAWPLYGLATYVGYTRVHAQRHRWIDVAGAAGVTTVMSWWLVTPKSSTSVMVVPEFGRDHAGLVVTAQW